jgi:hypothetical protein
MACNKSSCILPFVINIKLSNLKMTQSISDYVLSEGNII